MESLEWEECLLNYKRMPILEKCGSRTLETLKLGGLEINVGAIIKHCTALRSLTLKYISADFIRINLILRRPQRETTFAIWNIFALRGPMSGDWA